MSGDNKKENKRTIQDIVAEIEFLISQANIDDNETIKALWQKKSELVARAIKEALEY
jgi:NACalpha-BTF3-like transcription factor